MVATQQDIDWQQLADDLTARLEELGWKRKDLADVTGMSTKAIDNLLHARRDSYYDSTLRRVSEAVGWGPEGCYHPEARAHPRAPATARTPQPADGPPSTRLDDLEDQVYRLRRDVREEMGELSKDIAGVKELLEQLVSDRSESQR